MFKGESEREGSKRQQGKSVSRWNEGTHWRHVCMLSLAILQQGCCISDQVASLSSTFPSILFSLFPRCSWHGVKDLFSHPGCGARVAGNTSPTFSGTSITENQNAPAGLTTFLLPVAHSLNCVTTTVPQIRTPAIPSPCYRIQMIL